jgi:hypothetical protein
LDDHELDNLGVDLVAILRKGKSSQKGQAIEAAADFIEGQRGWDGGAPRTGFRDGGAAVVPSA